MSFVQKEYVLIVLDETHLSFATFVLPKFHHFKFGLFDISNSIWIQMLQLKQRATICMSESCSFAVGLEGLAIDITY